MRWVILTDDHPPLTGGVSTFVGSVACELAARGHEVQVFARRRRALAAVPGTRLTPVRGPRFGRWGGRWLGIRSFPQLLTADAVLATTWSVATVAARMGCPLVVVAHGSDVTCPPVRPEAFRRVWRAAEGRFAMSQYLARELSARGVTAGVLPAPIEPGPVPPRGEARGTWGLLARAVANKGGDRFVRLVAAAGVNGVVIGDGPARPAWERLALQLGARVRFVGDVPHARVAGYLEQLDLLCLLPRCDADGRGAEGLGFSLIEAAALGVPAVGCTVGGVPEAVGPGLLLEDPDDAEASAAEIGDWWSPERGREAWAWCRANHGSDRCVDLLEGALA
ncbi:MAG: glycosyltransferase family 4 protein [Myxococcales bacterium]|nr:glycosyltransferase family 4 protein [Myxococcales bacterium]